MKMNGVKKNVLRITAKNIYKSKLLQLLLLSEDILTSVSALVEHVSKSSPSCYGSQYIILYFSENAQIKNVNLKNVKSINAH